jgi:hypothetical protein
MISPKLIVRCIISVCLLCVPGFVQACGAQSDVACVLPVALTDRISRDYPGTHPVDIADLTENHRQMFRRDHGTACPGLVKIDFYGDGSPTWAIALTKGVGTERTVQLLVARQADDVWEIRPLDKTNGTAVVWSEGPGTYKDVYGQKTIEAKDPVIHFVGYESWGIIYAWNGTQVDKVWTSD